MKKSLILLLALLMSMGSIVYAAKYTVNTSGTVKHDAHLYGNIGVTTSQQMLSDELDIQAWNIYEHITDAFLTDMVIYNDILLQVALQIGVTKIFLGRSLVGKQHRRTLLSSVASFQHKQPKQQHDDAQVQPHHVRALRLSRHILFSFLFVHNCISFLIMCSMFTS